MKSKGLLSLILIFCMVMQMLPVFADGEAAAEPVYIINDTFETGAMDGWVAGETTYTEDTDYKYGVEDVDGVKALTMETLTGDMDGVVPNLFRDFDDVEYSEDKRIVVKTRFKKTGGTANERIYLKLNRPNLSSFGGNEMGYNWYTLLHTRGTSIQTNHATDHSSGQTIADVNTDNKWIEAEMVIDGIAKEAHITVAIDGQSYGPVTGTINDISKNVSSTLGGAYTAAGVDEATGFTSFNSLTWAFRFNACKLYVDYVQAYEIDNVTVALDAASVYAKDNITLSASKEIPVSAVSLTDASGQAVPAAVTYADGKITINPESSLTQDATYKVVLDKTALDAAYIMVNAYEFEVYAISETGTVTYLVDDDFGAVTETDTGGLDGWTMKEYPDAVAGPVLTTEDIGDGNYALKYTATSTNDEWVLNYIDRALETPYTFVPGQNVVIETRMRLVENSFRAYLKYNMQNASYDYREWNYDWGTLLKTTPDGVHSINGRYANNTYANQATIGSFDTNGWHTARVIFNGTTKTVDVSVTDASGNIYTQTGLDIAHYADAGWNETVLNTLNFRIRSDSGSSTIYVDYIKAYAATPVTVALDNAEIYENDNITLTVDKEISAEVISLTDASGQAVPASVTYADGKITINPESSLAKGVTYKVVINEAALLESGFIASKAEFAVNIVKPSAEMLVKATYGAGEDITVTFNTDSVSEAFKDAVALYNQAGEAVATVNTLDEASKAVILSPEADLTEGDVYKIKLDAAALAAAYNITGKTEKSFTVKDGSYIMYNDFESGSMGDWVLGATTSADGTYSYGVEEVDGTNALKMSLSSAGDANLYYDVDDVEYKAGKKIVIKTRIKKTGATNNERVFIKLNRPNITNFGTGKNEVGWYWYVLGDLRGTRYNTRGESDPTVGSALLEADLASKWVDVEIVLDGINQKSYTTVKVDGRTYGPQAGAMFEVANSSSVGGAYAAAGVDETTGFTAFDSLTFISPYNADTYYIDYIYAYEVDDIAENIKAELLDENGNTVTELTAGAKVIPTFTVQPEYGTEASYVLISAVYADGVLDGMRVKPITTTGTVYADTEGYTFEDTQNITVKAFIWNSLGGMVPATSAATAYGGH